MSKKISTFSCPDPFQQFLPALSITPPNAQLPEINNHHAHLRPVQGKAPDIKPVKLPADLLSRICVVYWEKGWDAS
jgi:hypothetical protein